MDIVEYLNAQMAEAVEDKTYASGMTRAMAHGKLEALRGVALFLGFEMDGEQHRVAGR